MPKKIPDHIRRVYTTLLADPEWQDASIVAIHHEACNRLMTNGVPESDHPQIPWAYKIGAEFRTKLSTRDIWLNSPFSIQDLSDPSFATDPRTVEHLGLLQRRSIAGGSVLSRRRAIWVTRLSHFFPVSNIHFWPLWWCWDWAGRYAEAELSHSLIGGAAFMESLDRELLFVEWPEQLSDTQTPQDVAKFVLRVGLDNRDRGSAQANTRGKLREKLKQLKQPQLMPDLFDDIIAERYLELVDLLSGARGGNHWDEKLSAVEYDVTFLALRTVVDRDSDRWSKLRLHEQLGVADQLAIDVRSNDSDAVRELIAMRELPEEVEA